MNGVVELGILPDTITNEIGMQLKRIPAGEFMMGSKLSAKEVAEKFAKYQAKEKYYTNEHPRHKVRISQPFHMGIHEVTIGQFRQFVNATAYRTEAERDGEGGSGWNKETKNFEGRKPVFNWKNTGWSQTDNHPVVNVTWNDATEFCRWLSRRTGVKYRLPTEAEWEYACRAGTESQFHSGNDVSSLSGFANLADQAASELPNRRSDYPWAPFNDGQQFSGPVGSYRSNAFGLFDMHGNVWEWCQDWYGAYSGSVQLDPTGPTSGSSRVLRGGSWGYYPSLVRSANRDSDTPDYRSGLIGFRVVCVSG